MSIVSGVTLHMSAAEKSFEQDGKDVVHVVDKINGWLAEQHFGQLVSVEGHYGGNKHPQVLVYGGGYNYFPEDEFAKFVLSLVWDEPEEAVLLIQPDEGPTKIYRPPLRQLSQ